MSMRRKKGVFEVRDDLTQHMVSIWNDAIAFKMTHAEVLDRLAAVRKDKQYQRLTRVDRSYVEGFVRSYEIHIIQPMTECGSWVGMPDSSVRWFGSDRLRLSTAELDRLHPELAEYGIHRYIHENSIPDRSGIYWMEDLKRNCPAGTRPFFIPRPEVPEVPEVRPSLECPSPVSAGRPKV